MTVDAARKWLVVSSLAVTGGIFTFFTIAPAAGFPLTFAQSLRIVEVILPVFLGYLGSAASFVFRSSSSRDSVIFRQSTAGLVGLLIAGPMIVSGIAILSLVIAFGITNGRNAAPGAGLTVDQLTIGISATLGLLAVTTNVAVGYLFGGNSDEHARSGGGGDPDNSAAV